MVTVANDRPRIVLNVPALATEGLSLAELLRAPGLAGATVLAGASGLHRLVRWVAFGQPCDGVPAGQPHGLLLSAGAPPGEQSQLGPGLLRDLEAQQLAGLAITPGRGLDGLAQPLLDLADELGFPVLRLPDGASPDEVLAGVYGVLLNQQNQVLAQSEALHRAITRIVLGGGGLPQIADEMSRLLDCVLLITTPDGRVLAAEGTPPHREAVEAAELFDSSGRFLVERLRIGRQPARDGQVAMTSIVAGGVDHGRIVAYRHRAVLPPGTGQALEQVAIVAALTITKELAVSAVEGKFRGDYLRDVLTGQVPVDEPVVHCRSLGWDIDRPMAVLVAELDRAEPDRPGIAPAGPSVVQRSQHERFVSAWQQVLRARDKTVPVVGFSHEVVALVPADPKRVSAVSNSPRRSASATPRCRGRSIVYLPDL